MACGPRAAQDRPAFWLTAAAFTWSVALIVGAIVLPVYSDQASSTVTGAIGTVTRTVSTGSTLVAQNGSWVLVPVAVPAVLTIVVGLALRIRGATGSPTASAVATAGFVALGCLALVGILTIGFLVLPVTVLPGWAAARTPRGGPLAGAGAELR